VAPGDVLDGDTRGRGGTVTRLGVRSHIGMIPYTVVTVYERVAWVVRLVKVEADDHEPWVDVVRIARPGDLAKPGRASTRARVTMTEGEGVRAGSQKKFVAWQSQDWSGQAAIAACGC
jgi:hypothetical protein